MRFSADASRPSHGQFWSPPTMSDIFISWSCDDAKEIALALKEFFSSVLKVKAFCSTKDIPPGTVWNNEIRDHLVKSKFGVIVLTPSSRFEPWLFFEAGGIQFSEKQCCPLLCGITESQLPRP